ncbi:MAG: diguanylate cyclase [Gammaproteobacteria bacterium]|nr:diguanylate cyclase [Gammaproteobacteria bacterium]
MSNPQVKQLRESYKFGIRAKTLVVLLVAALIGLGISTAVYFYASQKTSRQQAIEHLKTATEIQADRLEQLRGSYFQRLELLTSRTQLRLSLKDFAVNPQDGDARNQVERILGDAVRANDDFLVLHLYSTSGNPILSVKGADVASASENLPFETMPNGQDIHLIEHSGDSRLLFGGPLRLEGETLGYLVVEAGVGQINDIVDTYSGLGETGETIVAATTMDGDVDAVVPLRFDVDGTEELTIQPAKSDELVVHDFVDYREKEVIAIERAISGSDWIVFVKRDKQEIFAESRELQKLMLVALLVATVVVLALGIYFSGSLTRALVHISSVARKIAKGDLARRVSIQREDEIGDLAVSINTMTDRLVDMNANLEHKVEQRTQELHEAYEHLETLNSELEVLARKDSLTGLANRRAFDETFEREWQRAMREENPLGLMLIDVDFFKRINDIAGHEAGDRALENIARLLQGRVQRAADLLVRYGGEEFAVIAPNTDTAGMQAFAEYLRATVEAYAGPHPAPEIDNTTVSIGVASIVPGQGETSDVLFEAADAALYRAKELGRNRVCTGGAE